MTDTITTDTTTATLERRFAVKISRAKMPSSCWGGNHYERIGLMEVDPEYPGEPKMISDRARGVIRVLETWEDRYRGSTDQCAAAKAEAEAELLADILEDLTAGRPVDHHPESMVRWARELLDD